MESEEEEIIFDIEPWLPICNSLGFMYFYNKTTGECQWGYPKKYDSKKKKYVNIFKVSFKDWEKVSNNNQIIWRNYKLQITQLVSPTSSTYFLEASFTGNVAFLNLYLSYNGDINVIDKKSRNALHFSVMNDHYELTRILCLYNIDLNRKDFNGQSPIFYAISYRAYKSLRVLVENNSELNHQDNNGDSIMHFAVSNSNLKLINFLSSKGASVLLKNKNGIYPIDIAAEGNNTDLMQYLAKLGNYMRFNQIISTSQKKEDDLESDQEKENILDYKIDDNILKQKSFQSFPSFNFDKSNIKDSKKSSLNIDSINFESGMENNFDKSKRSIISREERSKFSKTNNSKKKSFGIGEGEIQASEKKITKKRKKKNTSFLDQAKNILFQNLSYLKDGLFVMGGWLKEGSLVARDNLAVYGVQMTETLGKMFEYSKGKFWEMNKKVKNIVKRLHFNLFSQPDIENQIKYQESEPDLKNDIFEPERRSYRGRLYTVNKSLALSKSLRISKPIRMESDKEYVSQEISEIIQPMFENDNKSTIKTFPLKLHKKIKRSVHKMSYMILEKKYSKIKNKKYVPNEREIIFHLRDNIFFSRNSDKILIKKFIFMKRFIGKKYYNMLNVKNSYNILNLVYKKYSIIQDKIIKEELYMHSLCNKYKLLKYQVLSNLNRIKFMIEKEYREVQMQNPPNSINFDNYNFFQNAKRGRYDNNQSDFLVKSIETLNNLLDRKPSHNKIQINFNKQNSIYMSSVSNNLGNLKYSNSLMFYNNYLNKKNELAISKISETIGGNKEKPKNNILIGSNLQPQSEISSNEIKFLKKDKETDLEKAARYCDLEKNTSSLLLEEFEKKISFTEETKMHEIIKPRNSTLISHKHNEKILGEISKIEEENWDEINSLMEFKLHNEGINNNNSSKKSLETDQLGQFNKKLSDEEQDNESSQESLGLGIENIINNYNEQLFKIKTNKVNTEPSDESSEIKKINQTSFRETHFIKMENITILDKDDLDSFISYK